MIEQIDFSFAYNNTKKKKTCLFSILSNHLDASDSLIRKLLVRKVHRTRGMCGCAVLLTITSIWSRRICGSQCKTRVSILGQQALCIVPKYSNTQKISREVSLSLPLSLSLLIYPLPPSHSLSMGNSC